MDEVKRFSAVINAVILLILLFGSNFFVGRFVGNGLVSAMEGASSAIGIFSLVLPGGLSTFLVYLVYIKAPFVIKIGLQQLKLKIYLAVQGSIMMFLEPLALFISIMATDAPGSGIKEMLMGFSFIWWPVNGIIWIIFVVSLMFKEKESAL